MHTKSADSCKRARSGFGSKDLFFSIIKPHFDTPANARRLATSLLGCASEQWVNAELFQALVASGRDFFVWPENEKHDLVVYRDHEQKEPELIVETKLLYATYPRKKKDAKLADLARQLKRARDNHPDAQAIGLIVGFEYVNARDGKSLPRAPLDPFVSPDLRLTLRNAFGHASAYRVQGATHVEIGTRAFAVRTSLEMVKLAAS